MERMYHHVLESQRALVLANPGTQEERIYLMKEVITSSSGAWFRTDVTLPRGTLTQVIFRLKYGTENKILMVKFFGKVVRSEHGGFEVAFEYP